jgi:hypothetical protein
MSTSGTGNASSSSGSGGSGPSASKACGDEAAALCALRESCSPGYDVKRVYGTSALCESRTAQVCINALDANSQANTPANVEACAAAYPKEMCPDLFDNDPIMACVPPAGGLVNLGTACGASGQCATTYCAITQDAVCGTCQMLPNPGAPCQVQEDCGRDLGCAIPTGATSGKCAAFAAATAACLTGTIPCQSGLSCVGDDEVKGTMGACQTAASTVGAMCDATRKNMPSCDTDKGLVCVPTAAGSGVGTCKNIQLVAAGAACGDIGAMPITGFAVCEAGGLCKKAAPNDTTGTCVAPAADGAACDNDPANGPPCLTPAKCVVPAGSSGTAGTCVVPNASTCM